MKRNLILIVEDDRDIRENYQELFESENFPVALAENGKIALDLLQSNSIHPSLIFLDLMMPVMDGITFLNHIEADPVLKLIPIVVVTASPEKLKGHFVALINKPVSIEKLLLTAEKYAVERSQDSA